MGDGRSWGAQLVTVFGVFVGGALLGGTLAERCAPGSALGAVVGMFMLPAALFLGFWLWLGWAILRLLVALPGWILRRRRPAWAEGGMKVPPGAFGFVVSGAVAGLAGGALCGLVAPAMGWLSVVALFTVVGSAYGVALWRLAGAGYLPFLEE